MAGEKRMFGQYEVICALGNGSMGTVFLARETRIGRRVALKTISVDGRHFEDPSSAGEFFERLQREAELCGQLNHPNIVQLYEAGYEGDRISYLAIEYVAGESLQALIRRDAPLPVDEALGIIAGILRGLAYAHARDIVHRDIKPANILISDEGEAKIADFGIARPSQSNLTVAGTIMGTPNYMSPEQVKGTSVTPRSDLFSVGIVLFEMLTGRKPFAGADLHEVLFNITQKTPPPLHEINPEVPSRVDTFLRGLIAREPENRFDSAGTALDELSRLRLSLSKGSSSRKSEGKGLPAAAEATQPDTAALSAARRASRLLPLPAVLFRVLPSWVLPAVVATVVAVSGLGGYYALRVIDAPMPVRITPEQEAEFRNKKEQLAQAQALHLEGRHDESMSVYEEYLERYPWSDAARDGYEEARAAREAQLVEAEAPAASTSRAGSPRKEPGGPASLKDRLRRIFRRGDG